MAEGDGELPGFCRVIGEYLNPNRLCVWGVIYYAWLKTLFISLGIYLIDIDEIKE